MTGLKLNKKFAGWEDYSCTNVYLRKNQTPASLNRQPARSRSNSRLVYSTDGGMIDESAPAQHAAPLPADGVVRIRRETKGRKGEPGSSASTRARRSAEGLATLLRRSAAPAAASRGDHRDPGDKRDLIRAELERAGFQV